MRPIMSVAARHGAYGQTRKPSLIDRFGVWLSALRIRKYVADFHGLRIGDVGCGYNARFTRSVLHRVASAVLVDLALAPDLKNHGRVTAVEGLLPAALGSLPDGSLDVVLCVSVLEHLAQPLEALVELKRLCAPQGVVLLNVPSWRGKWFLEFAAFRLKLAPAEEMDDHKMYYDPRDLWPLLIRAGFRPSRVTVFKHKFGLNTFAVCRNGP